MAAYARDVLKRPWIIISGHRTYDEQVVLYKLWLEGKGNPAAVPGTSGHEFHIAADTHGPGTNWPELMADYKLSPLKQLLAKYGLYISNWLGASGTTHEWWHVQPIERFGYTGAQAAFLLPDDRINEEDEMLKKGDKGPAVGAWQRALLELGYKMVGADGKEYGADDNFGTASVNGTNKFKADNSLPQDGIVDLATWSKMLDAMRGAIMVRDDSIKTLTGIKTVLSTELNSARARISAAKTALA
jgi:hypothetical protein